MSKIFAIYENVQLIECPEKWDYYKEAYKAPLILMESEKKFPGKKFFNFCGLRSTVIRSFITTQETLQDDIYIEIITLNSRYVFKVMI